MAVRKPTTSRAANAPQRARLLVDERRAQLWRWASKLFAERSYDEVSIDELARVANISKGLLITIFRRSETFTRRHFGGRAAASSTKRSRCVFAGTSGARRGWRRIWRLPTGTDQFPCRADARGLAPTARLSAF